MKKTNEQWKPFYSLMLMMTAEGMKMSSHQEAISKSNNFDMA
jgi:hypothetical protein